MKRLILTLFTLCPSLLAANPNIVIIAVDELRPQLRCYGVEQVGQFSTVEDLTTRLLTGKGKLGALSAKP